MIPAIDVWRDRFEQWREPPWGLKPFAVQSRSYRALVCATIAIFATSGAALAWHLDSVSRMGDPATAALAIILTVFMSLVVFRGNEVTTLDPVNVIPLALVFGGQDGLAIACLVISMVTTPIRKQLVPHLILGNAAAAIWMVSVTAWFFEWAAGGSSTLDGRWTLAAFAAYALFLVLEFAAFTPVVAAGGYVSFRQSLRELPGHMRSLMLSMAPLTVMIGVVVAHQSVAYLLFALTPFLIAYEIFARTEQLVEATTVAQRDPLTGLHNRRTLMATLENVMGKPGETQENWVILCDLDDFKQLNDTRGHEAGDEALVAAARQIEASIRERDYCARYGGEEFVAVISDVSLEQVSQIAERIRAKIEVELACFGTTVSVGVYAVTANDSPMTALNGADQAMYKSKRSGKNRVSFWSGAGSGRDVDSAAA